MSCKRIEIPRRGVCIGDLNKLIKLVRRDIAGEQTNVYVKENFTDYAEVWAGVKTIKGKQVFDGVNLLGVATHEFYINYDANVDRDYWVEYDGNYFENMEVEDLDERHEFLVIRAKITAPKTVKAGWA